MTAFTFDTSGFVEGRPEGIRTKRFWWEDLTPFAQGYVEALFAEWSESLNEQGQELLSWRRGVDKAAFSDLSPEALRMILGDCVAQEQALGGPSNHEAGEFFWHERQQGLGLRFPPLTVSLGDYGKIYLKTA